MQFLPLSLLTLLELIIKKGFDLNYKTLDFALFKLELKFNMLIFNQIW